MHDIANINLYYEIHDGFTYISWESQMNETGKILLKSFVLGLEGINDQYNCIEFN